MAEKNRWIKDYQWNYPADVFTKWRQRYFYSTWRFPPSQRNFRIF